MKADKTVKTLNRREFSGLALGSIVPLAAGLAAPGAGTSARLQSSEASAQSIAVSGFETLYPGVWKATLGVPGKISPVKLRFRKPAAQALRKMYAPSQCPIPGNQIRGEQTDRGFVLKVPLGSGERVYGFGLQFLSFQQRYCKKVVRTNADPRVNSGDTNAPVPFYVTTGGYGVLIDSSRYVSFYVGRESRADAARNKSSAEQLPPSGPHSSQAVEAPNEVVVDIPSQQGADIYIFGGPAMLQAVERYNLFSGGGCLPPRWGLGLWYRCEKDYNAKQVLNLAEEFRRDQMPCDVFGLEPGWQTHAYSCTFVWHPERFPDPAGMIRSLARQNFHLNLWEHAFTNPTSPLYEPLKPLAGNFEVWGGLAPDFLKPEARKIFADYHEKHHMGIGVSGFKLDECDNSDFTGGWSFPECSQFPSGVDGEQMHSHFGLAYQETIEGIFRRRNTRTYQLVRSTNALAAPYPFALYSDLYDHQQYIRAIVNSGFSGLLWAAEVRNANNAEDMIRRLQTACFSALMQVDAWFLMNPPWKQVSREANNAGRIAPNWRKLEAQCREVIRLRMQLVPYLYSSFVRYHEWGTPPFRALVMDHPTDPQVWKIDDQFMVGESLMVAPVIAGVSSRNIYLPKGDWVDFWTGKHVAGGQTVTMQVPLDIIPVFVKSGTLLPLARPALHAGDPESRHITVRVYGKGDRPCTLYEDDDSTLDALHGKYDQVVLTWDDASKQGHMERTGRGDYPRYEIVGWERI